MNLTQGSQDFFWTPRQIAPKVTLDSCHCLQHLTSLPTEDMINISSEDYLEIPSLVEKYAEKYFEKSLAS